jgi:UDP-4-amino-4-deoxy-L-arabinose formyltransferase/UDP-glucuronic acid dehydrogenase (UDP-4-keto-hexauronic acid decarboxylating)
VLVAEEAAGVRALELLVGGPHRVVAVLTGDAAWPADATPVGAAAVRVACPVWPARLVRDPALADTLRRHDVDLLLNVHSLFIAHTAVVAAPRLGSFNVHPGPLPAYAGLNAPSWAIYHGERAHAVTIHWMDAGIDTGPIAYQAPLTITERDTGYTLSAKCTTEAMPLLQALVAAASGGADAIPQRPQADGPRRHHGREAPQGGRLDWTAPARRVVNYIRAADYSPFPSPWGHPRTWVDGRALGVVSGRDGPAGRRGSGDGRAGARRRGPGGGRG